MTKRLVSFCHLDGMATTMQWRDDAQNAYYADSSGSKLHWQALKTL
jgi:hypothetical protein